MRKLLISIGCAIVLCVVNYFVNNYPLFSGISLDKLFVLETFRSKFHSYLDTRDVLVIDTSFDTQIADQYEVSPGHKPVYKGTTGVADRAKLTELLRRIEHADYKYLIIDIEFPEGLYTDCDSILYSQIGKMDRVVIGHADSPLDPRISADSSKLALATYYSTITATNFTTYEYLHHDESSIPLKVYEAADPENSIKRFGPKYLSIYKSGNCLCQNCLFLTFNDSNFSSGLASDGSTAVNELACIQLGGKALYDQDYDISNAVKGKYVIITNAEEDKHDTYYGQKSGYNIIVQALRALENDKHKLSPLYCISWLLAYTLIFYYILGRFNLSSILSLRYRNQHPFQAFTLNLVGVGSFLFVFHTMEFFCRGVLTSVLVPTIVFSILQLYCDFERFKSKIQA